MYPGCQSRSWALYNTWDLTDGIKMLICPQRLDKILKHTNPVLSPHCQAHVLWLKQKGRIACVESCSFRRTGSRSRHWNHRLRMCSLHLHRRLLINNSFIVAVGGARTPRVFCDEFVTKFVTKFGDEFSESLNLVQNLVTKLVTNVVMNGIRWQIQWQTWWQIKWSIVFGDTFGN